MKQEITANQEYHFEVSWEVCNMVGGIYTVVSTKALSMSRIYGDKYILIGPDLWRKSESHPEFVEDNRLFKSWRQKAKNEGLRIKVGRWKIEGNPIVILVDFTTLIKEKDRIFSELWEQYKLNSISGQWDYIEPALFGYASGRVIESFILHSSSVREYSIAHFHEWMTGTGLLYLKNRMPQVGSIFTTHATVLGRCIAGNNLPLYGEMDSYQPEELARHFNVSSKYSLEKCSAQYADCFTTVSAITAKECRHFLGKPVDLITPNGFEPDITPNDEEYVTLQQSARSKLLQVARAVVGQSINNDALLVGISGRYEFKNKGVDVFIEALNTLKHKYNNNRELVAFILIPAGNDGVNAEMQHNIEQPEATIIPGNNITTHNLIDYDNDPAIKAIRQFNLTNDSESKVKIVFVPCYLNGNDGVFNMSYYNILVGLDLSIFPSYYEPWGYTPMESVAFRVPTITTTLAGFGLWVKDNYEDNPLGIKVIFRDDTNTESVVEDIAFSIDSHLNMSAEETMRSRESALDVSKIALWDNFIKHYQTAFDISLSKASERLKVVSVSSIERLEYFECEPVINDPHWVSVVIHKSIPDKLIALEELSKNMWWCWNEDAMELFNMIDCIKWGETENNPIALLDSISMTRYKELENDREFTDKLSAVYSRFKDYMLKKDSMSGVGVAYLCMEYALHASLKIYSGGLGVLAGDYLKEASDKSVKIAAVGLLYRYGYFTQQISKKGEQETRYEAQDFMKLPIIPMMDENHNWHTVSLPFPGRVVYARLWRVDVGRIELYLLDTDFEDNLPEDRTITHHLYGGDLENRLKQELVLGFGGVEALRQLGIDAKIYHYNEGHAAFAGLKRLEHYINDENLTFTEAMEVVRSSSLFTTHTPVPAGHDYFTENMLRGYISHFAEELKISWEQLISLGRSNPNDITEKFSMSFLAAKMSQEINGVSRLHGDVTKDIFKPLWQGYFPEELHVSYVTNGVHYPTWSAPEWKDVCNELFGEDFVNHHYDKSCFNKIYDVDDSKIVSIRQVLRGRLIEKIKDRVESCKSLSYFTPRQCTEINENLRDDVLTIGFARRFATYKRAHLLFSDLDKLNEIVNNPERPVQFIYAGKAHPADHAGQDLIKKIIEISKMPQFIGRIIFLPNYDMSLAKYLISGVDVWMNTPTRPLEASGTSGEKAAMNGVMHLSVLDGWWVEGYSPDAGWMLPQERMYENQTYQDELDAETLYNIIENDITKVFYDKNMDGVSEKWIEYIKNTIAKVASEFTTNRMLGDYENKYYIPMGERSRMLVKDNYALALNIAQWKQKVLQQWQSVELVDYSFPSNSDKVLAIGSTYTADIVLDIGELSAQDVGVELVMCESVSDKLSIKQTFEFEVTKEEYGRAHYHVQVVAEYPGLIQLAIRIYPKNELLPHRQDFALVKWL